MPGPTCIRSAERCSILLTGRVPFEGHNLAQLTANVLEKPAPSPRDFRKEIPKGLASVILRCLAKQPATASKATTTCARRWPPIPRPRPRRPP